MNDKMTPSDSLDQTQLVEQLRLAAQQGNAEAQFRLGVIYGNADGVELDRKQALQCFTQAARQGHEQALISLAWMYANGSGVDIDEKRAFNLYQMAADHGSAKAQYLVATHYRFDQLGAGRNLDKALHYYQLSASQGYPSAQFALGKLLFEAKWVAADDAAALHWMMLAHTGGNARAEEYIRTLMQRMSADEVAAVRAQMLSQAPSN